MIATPKVMGRGLSFLVLYMVASIVGLTTGINSALGQENDATHPGYLDSVKEERFARVTEVVFVAPSEPSRDQTLKQRIFSDKLSHEFQQKYARTFGWTAVEQNLDAPSRFDSVFYTSGVQLTSNEDVKKKQEFGNYMMKRLIEHHVDDYFKSNPSVRPIYELKERISNVKVEVRKGYRLKINYSFSGNFMNLQLDNPHKVSNKLTVQMNESSFGPSNVEEAIISMGYPLSSTVSLDSHLKAVDGVYSLIGSKTLSRSLQASVTGSTYIRDHGTTIRQHRLLLGFSYAL